MTELQAHPNGCEEASTASREFYIPCNRPATRIVGWIGRPDTPIRMCDFCTAHNVKNRGGEIKGTFIAEPGTETLSVQMDIVDQIAATETAEQLIAKVIALKDKIALADKQYAIFCKPWKDTIAECENKLLAMLNEQRLDSMRADSGTAYKSTIVSYKVIEREKVLDLINENWESFGSDMLQLGVTKDAVKKYVEENGKLPEGITSDSFTRINIRRGS